MKVFRSVVLAVFSLSLTTAAFGMRAIMVNTARMYDSVGTDYYKFRATCTEEMFLKLKSLATNQGGTSRMTARTGPVKVNEFKITKSSDAASLKLQKALADKENLKIGLTFYNVSPTGREVKYYVITLTNARVTEVRKGTAGVEYITFRFEKSKVG